LGIDACIAWKVLCGEQLGAYGDGNCSDVAVQRTIVDFVRKTIDSDEAGIRSIGKCAIGTKGDESP